MQRCCPRRCLSSFRLLSRTPGSLQGSVGVLRCRLSCPAHSLPLAAVTNYHKSSGSKQCELIRFHLEVRSLKSRCGQSWFLICSTFPSVLRGPHPLAGGPFLPVSSHRAASSGLSLTLTPCCEDTGPPNHPISGFLTRSHLEVPCRRVTGTFAESEGWMWTLGAVAVPRTGACMMSALRMFSPAPTGGPSSPGSGPAFRCVTSDAALPLCASVSLSAQGSSSVEEPCGSEPQAAAPSPRVMGLGYSPP